MGETFMVEGGEGLKTAERADLQLEGPGISDLISFMYGRGGHSANASVMTLSSGLRLGRAPERHVDNAELEISNNLIQVIPKTKRHSRRFSGVVQAIGTPRVSSLSRGLYSQLRPLTKK